MLINRASLKVPRDYTYRGNTCRTILLYVTLRLSKQPIRWVYSLFLASFSFALKKFSGFLSRTAFFFKFRSKLAIKLRSNVGSYSVPSLVRTEMINWLMYSFSSTAEISSILIPVFVLGFQKSCKQSYTSFSF